jgi:hypothetical protein
MEEEAVHKIWMFASTVVTKVIGPTSAKMATGLESATDVDKKVMLKEIAKPQDQSLTQSTSHQRERTGREVEVHKARRRRQAEKRRREEVQLHQALKTKEGKRKINHKK